MDRLIKGHQHYFLLALMMAICARVNLAQSSRNASVDAQLATVLEKLETINLRLQQLEIQQKPTTPIEPTNETEKALRSSDCCCPKPRDCADLRPHTSVSGVYTIYIGVMQRPLLVYCDMQTDGGGWTVIQRRKDGTTTFYRNWNAYTSGFGVVTNEFWLGNENIHWLTSYGKQYKLRIDLRDFNNNTRYAEYDDFKVGSTCSKYQLSSVGSYCGTAGDSLMYHFGAKFSTFDQDNDPDGANCALAHNGGWWYVSCHTANLNGRYYNGSNANENGVVWYHWLGYHYSLRNTEMKIRPADV